MEEVFMNLYDAGVYWSSKWRQFWGVFGYLGNPKLCFGEVKSVVRSQHEILLDPCITIAMAQKHFRQNMIWEYFYTAWIIIAKITFQHTST